MKLTRRRSGFTLFEIVLAIGLTAMVVYLVSMAAELYITNVDASRTRVETAQLARVLLDQIAADLAHVQLTPPKPSPSGAAGSSGAFAAQGSQPGGGQPSAGGGDPSSQAPSSGSPGSAMPSTAGPAALPGTVPGVMGTADQLRIDRAAYANWERASRNVELAETAAAADMPVTVRYFFVSESNNRSTTQAIAQQGVGRPSATITSGLYRETIPTAAIPPTDAPLLERGAVRSGGQVELLAPEVIAFEVTYFDGADTIAEWDPATDGGQPRAIEILLTLAEPRYQARPSAEEQQRLSEGRYLQHELVEYRRFVRLPLVAPSPAAQALLPSPETGNAGAPGAAEQDGNGAGGGNPVGGGSGQPSGGQQSSSGGAQ